MDYNRIDAALRDADDTHHLLIGTGALDEVGKVLEQAFGQQSAVVVSDDNTYAVAGKAVSDRLRSSGWTVEESLVFPGTPPLYASFENVLALEEATCFCLVRLRQLRRCAKQVGGQSFSPTILRRQDLGLPRFERVGELGIYFVKKGKPRCRKTNERLRRSLNRRRYASCKRAGRALPRWPVIWGSPIVPCITGANWSPSRESRHFLAVDISPRWKRRTVSRS